MIINMRVFMAAILISSLAFFALARGAVAASAEEIDHGHVH